MRQKSRFLIGLGLAVALVAGFTMPAAAVNFTFSQIGGFNDTTETCQGGCTASDGIEFFRNVGTPPNTWAIIGWGDGSNAAAPAANSPWGNGDRSALALQTNGLAPDTNPPLDTLPALPTQITDGGGPVVISRLFHQNNPITDPTLTGVRIDTQLQIFAPGNVGVINSLGEITINFTETPNDGPGSDCNSPAPAGPFQNPLGSDCDDFFTFATDDLAPLFFSFDGRNYRVDFALVVPSGNTNCALADGQGSCVDFANGVAWTREGSTNRLDVTMEITEIIRGVPFPGTLMLLGLGLLGGVARSAWRKRA